MNYKSWLLGGMVFLSSSAYAQRTQVQHGNPQLDDLKKAKITALQKKFKDADKKAAIGALPEEIGPMFDTLVAYGYEPDVKFSKVQNNLTTSKDKLDIMEVQLSKTGKNANGGKYAGAVLYAYADTDGDGKFSRDEQVHERIMLNEAKAEKEGALYDDFTDITITNTNPAERLSNNQVIINTRGALNQTHLLKLDGDHNSDPSKGIYSYTETPESQELLDVFVEDVRAAAFDSAKNLGSGVSTQTTLTSKGMKLRNP